MDRGLHRLNIGLFSLTEAAGWPQVAVNETATVTWNERSVALCSESERWRAQACIQLTLAAITKSQVVVLDRVDILDLAEREALRAIILAAYGKANIQVLLFSTCDQRPLPERYASSGWPTVLIEGGTT